MKNVKIEPANSAVAKYINCYWLIEKTNNDSGPDFPKLNPDPAGHMIIADPKQFYQYKDDVSTISGYGSHLILPQCKTITIDHSKTFRIIGIKFQVGALYALKIPSKQVLLDQVIDFDVSKFLQSKEHNGTPRITFILSIRFEK
ncbi:MAG: hypothetical protein PF693_02680 [Spirochaetia bacterium]|jgi:hypothetical protein|nr:hypothetical protein [Spirochaetia bacterium]